MKKYKQLITGLVIGSMVGMGGSVFAQDSSIISVFVKKAISFEFNGEKKELPNKQVVFTYEGNTYAPVNFIAENLDSEIAYDETTKTISINGKKKEEIVKEEISKVEYHALPIRKFVGEACIKINGIFIDEDDNLVKVFLEVENEGRSPVRVEQRETKMIMGEEIYEQKDVKIFNNVQQRWFKDIKKDEKVDGTIKMPMPKDEELKDFTLVLSLFQNDASAKTTEVKFNITLDE